MRLEGKRILITGTGGGQGHAAQALFAREGARVVGCDVQQGAAEQCRRTMDKAMQDFVLNICIDGGVTAGYR